MYFVLTSILVLFFNSCSSDTDVLNEESNSINSSKIAAPSTECDFTGATPSANSQVTFTYTSDPANTIVTWSWQGAGISIVSGQGTHIATFQFGSNYDGGCITALGYGNLLCEALHCYEDGNIPNDCGYLLGFQDFNDLCSPYVTYIIPPSSLSINLGWTIVSYDWTFIANNGYTVTATGSQPTVNLSDTFCDCPWTATLVIGVTNAHGDLCQLTKTEYYQSGGSDLSPGCN